MKKIMILSLVIGLGAAGSAFAKKGGRKYGMAGCGLGSMVLGAKSGQIFASTTNGTAANQLFGITFGTSNCTPDGKKTAQNNVGVFVAANQASLATDIARGEGETLAALSGILRCDTGAMSKTLQSSYGSIYPNADVDSMQVSTGVIEALKSSDASCQALI